MNPTTAARIAAEKVREGFTRLHIKVGGRPAEADVQAIRKVWDAVGGSVRLAADANRSWTTRDALHVSLQCADIPFVMEQPCDTMEEVATIRGQVRHPIYLTRTRRSRATCCGPCLSGSATDSG